MNSRANSVENLNTRRIARWVPLVGVLLWLTACSVVGFGYSVVPSYLGYELNRYLDLDDDQRATSKLEIDKLLEWHRKAELPEVVELLERVRTTIKTPVAPNDLAWLRGQIPLRWEPVVQRLAEPMAQVALTLRSDQLARLKARYDSKNAQVRKDYLQSNVKERHQARVKRIRERAENLYGDFSEIQTKEIESAAAAFNFDSEAWFAERLLSQQAILGTLEKIRTERPSLPQATLLVRQTLLSMGRARDPRNAKAFEESARANDQLTAKIANMATPEQRARADKKLSGWIAEFKALSVK
jgi:Family of unknown function (DUF6279)